MFRTMLIIAAVSLLLAGCGGGKAGFHDFSAAPDVPVQQVYSDGCAQCHGNDGGGKFFGLMFKLEPEGKSTQELANTILSGRARMPAFPNLSEQQRMALAEYIQQLRQ